MVPSFLVEAALLPADQAVDEQEHRRHKGNAPTPQATLHCMSQQETRIKMDDRRDHRLSYLPKLLVASIVAAGRVRIGDGQLIDLVTELYELLIVGRKIAVPTQSRHGSRGQLMLFQELDIDRQHTVGQGEVEGWIERAVVEQLMPLQHHTLPSPTAEKVHSGILRAGVDQKPGRDDHHDDARPKHGHQDLAATRTVTITAHLSSSSFSGLYVETKLLMTSNRIVTIAQYNIFIIKCQYHKSGKQTKKC